LVVKKGKGKKRMKSLLLLLFCLSVAIAALPERKNTKATKSFDAKEFVFEATKTESSQCMGKLDNDNECILTAARVVRLKWGEIQVRNRKGDIKVFKDVLLFPSADNNTGVMNWDWSKSGTRHQPGVAMADLLTVMGQGQAMDVNWKPFVIISNGLEKALDITPQSMTLLQQLKDKNAITDYQIMPTNMAVKKYDEMWRNDRSVVALLHSTC
jgi:hypothetical protein